MATASIFGSNGRALIRRAVDGGIDISLERIGSSATVIRLFLINSDRAETRAYEAIAIAHLWCHGEIMPESCRTMANALADSVMHDD